MGIDPSYMPICLFIQRNDTKVIKLLREGGFFFWQWRRMYAYDKVRTGQGLQNLILNMHQNRFSLFEHCFLSVLPLSPPSLPLFPPLFNLFLLEGGKGWVERGCCVAAGFGQGRCWVFDESTFF